MLEGYQQNNDKHKVANIDLKVEKLGKSRKKEKESRKQEIGNKGGKSRKIISKITIKIKQETLG